MQLDKSV